MKKLASFVLLAAMMTGCVSDQVKQTITRNTARCDAMVQKVEDGETTRLEEQNFIRALRASFHSYDHYFNDAALPDDLKHLMDKEEEQ